MEPGVVGPQTIKREEPNRAAMTVGNIAAYRPYSGGMPAIVAKATPWGSDSKEPVTPAIKSARKLVRVLSRIHDRNGR